MRRNFHQLDDIAELLAAQGIAMWSVFFLIPVGRGLEQERIRPEEYELAFERLWHHARSKPYGVKTTEAPHYRRFVAQHEAERQQAPTGVTAKGASGHVLPRLLQRSEGPGHTVGLAPRGVNAGNGFVFVSHTGEVFPSGFLPVCGGNVRTQKLADIYRLSPLFRTLRDPDALTGRCGRCEFRRICGGSRSRAYGLTGDPFETDPWCSYVPGAPGGGAPRLEG